METRDWLMSGAPSGAGKYLNLNPLDLRPLASEASSQAHQKGRGSLSQGIDGDPCWTG